jgi:putative hydrolase
MKLYADYHTHTLYSHGKGTIRENVEAAIKKGLKEIVISDHGPGHLTYGVKRKNLVKMRKEIDELKKQYDNINILFGVEANLTSIDGDIDLVDEDFKLFDKVLMGYHNGAKPKTLKDGYLLFARNYLSKLVPSLREICRKTNTDAMIKAINKYKIDIITHPGAKVSIDTRELARAAAKRGTALEINSSHGYLTVEYVKIAMEEGVNFTIDSDAHRPEDVGNFVLGIDTAVKAGLPEERILNARKIE